MHIGAYSFEVTVHQFLIYLLHFSTLLQCPLTKHWIYRMYGWGAKDRMMLCTCAELSEYVYFVRRYFFRLTRPIFYGIGLYSSCQVADVFNPGV